MPDTLWLFASGYAFRRMPISYACSQCLNHELKELFNEVIEGIGCKVVVGRHGHRHLMNVGRFDMPKPVEFMQELDRRFHADYSLAHQSTGYRGTL